MPPRRRLTSTLRREHLLDVAADILREQGFAALTMEAVTKRAQVSRGLAYLHFANAEQLALALYEREVTELDHRIAALPAADSFEARVRVATKTYLDFAAERGGLLATLQHELTGRFSDAGVLRKLSGRFRFWSDVIVRELGVSANVAAPLARAAVASIEAFAIAWRSKKLTRAEAERMAVAFVLGGIGGFDVTRR
jgi:AcrR family transcriptional regulator